MLKFSCNWFFAALALATCSVAVAQTPCNPWKVQVYPDELSFGDRACIGISELTSPALALESGLMSGFSQWRNSPQIRKTDADDIAIRFAHLYERRAARATAETLVGYLHHEDPRLRSSGKENVWQRTRFAMLSVLESPDADGKERMAFAPLAGSLGSGLTSMALYQRQNSLGWGLERSGMIYSHYFARALFHEFSPELWHAMPQFVRNRFRPPDIPKD
jgi:hypothetical protein